MTNDVDPEKGSSCNIHNIFGIALTDTFRYKKIMVATTLPVFHIDISDYNVIMTNVCLVYNYIHIMAKRNWFSHNLLNTIG